MPVPAARRSRPPQPLARRDLLRWAVGRVQVDGDDAALAARLGALELSYVAAYQAMVGRGTLSALEQRIVTTFGTHHLGHASAHQTLVRTLDRSAPALTSDPDLDAELTLLVGAARGRPALLTVALHIEQIAAATATAAIEPAEGRSTVVLLAEVVPVEAQHALVLATLLDRPDGERLADFETTDASRLETDG